jgi:arylsulfatase A-like enzyme
MQPRPCLGWIASIALVAQVGCGSDAELREGAGRPQRIVLITLDTLRFDRLDPGHDDGQMPNTRALAASGAWFADFWAATSATQPTHATLFTGLHPWEHGVPINGAVLDGHHLTLAERLSQAGFATAAVVASFPLHPQFGFGQGFDVFVHDFERRFYEGSWAGAVVEDRRFFQLDDAITNRALELLDEAEAQDQFFWFHYFDPHEPYGDLSDTPLSVLSVGRTWSRGVAAYERTLGVARRLYDEDVARLDVSLGRLFRRLEEQSDRFDTHIVLTSDHGESFGEQGALGHGWRVTREQVQAPLAIVSPRVAPTIRHDVAGTADLTPTLLALAGLSEPGLPGRDLAQALEPGAGSAVGMSGGPAEPISAGAVSEERFFVVRDGRHYSGTADWVIEEDAAERVVTDVTVSEPLRALFGSFATILADTPVVERDDPDTLEALRALGYVE